METTLTGKVLKILHAPSNVCNIGWSFAQGLRAHGHSVEVWNHGPSPSGFKTDRVFDVGKNPRDYVECFIEALAANFDVFHFHGTRSLIPERRPLSMMTDLPLIKALGKKIVFTFHGSDVRLKSLDLADPWSFHHFADIACDETKIRSRLETLSQHADTLTVCNVLNLQYVPNGVYVPKAIDLDLYPAPRPLRDRYPVVLHATRRRETKGTLYIIEAVEKLRSAGLQFDFRLIENVTHEQLIQHIYDADIVVEKVLSGDLGVLGVESLMMGKVTLSRIRQEVYDMHPDLPAISVDPNTVTEILGDFIRNSNLRNETAQLGNAYATRTHGPDAVAKHLLRIYEGAPLGVRGDRQLVGRST